MLGKVLASAAQGQEGLSAIYLPAGVDAKIAFEIEEFYGSDSQVEPYVILVFPSGDTRGMSSSAALKYRQGNRLAVVVGRHPDLGSFTQSFREILGLNYPEQSEGPLSLSAVALAILRLLENENGRRLSEIETDSLRQYVLTCLELVRDLQQGLQQGGTSWNVQWFHQIDIGLGNLFETVQKSLSTTKMSLSDAINKYCFASFGLPTPPLSQSRSRNYTASQLATAYKEHWSDRETISKSIGNLTHSAAEADRDSMRFEKIDWDEFDVQVATTQNLGTGWAKHLASTDDAVMYFADLNDSQFVNPTPSLEKNSRIRAFDVDGVSLSPARQVESGTHYIAKASIDEWSESLRSEKIVLRIPAVGNVSQKIVDASAVKLRINGKLVDDVFFSAQESAEVVAEFEIETPLTRGKQKLEPKAQKITVEVSTGDSLAPYLPKLAPCEVFLVYPQSPGLWILPLRKGEKFGRQAYCGPEFFEKHSESTGESTFSIDLEVASGSQTGYRFVVWDDSSATPTFEGHEFGPLNDRENLYYFDSPLLERQTVLAGEFVFECNSSVGTSASKSPVIAAITNTPHSTDRLSNETYDSLRGRYERWICDKVNESSIIRALGHVVMPTDRSVDVFPADFHAESGFCMSSQTKEPWDMMSNVRVDPELRQSAAARNFIDAFENLGLSEMLADQSESSAAVPMLSTISWKHLWSRQVELERYLQAYVELMQEAKRLEDPDGIFWATYPFSVSLWSTLDDAQCHSVLLSPLHPVRLAWLASVEDTLFESEFAEALAGTVEGWNFPLLGPRESEHGRLIAVPMEGGREHVFVGWSILVSISAETTGVPTAPKTAGNLAMPGTSATGLDATSVSAALRAYKSMNPQISTLTVDLFANSGGQRIEEVDEALLSEIVSWSNDQDSPLFGGARIWDSIHRGGEPPRERVARLIRQAEGKDFPLVWRRYDSSGTETMAISCNVRILQDGGVKSKLKPAGDAQRLGVIGPIPLRRFESSLNSKGAGKSKSISSPTLADGQGWAPFTNAVREIERSTDTTQIETSLHSSQLTSSTADWTVSGETLMSPSAMAKIVQSQARGSQMLWEWRPPFFGKASNVSPLDRRPFVSIAKVPAGFRRQLESLLTKVLGEVDEKLVDDLLGTLGTRGVGLSSMLSMGGTHAAGALGFYLVFALMENYQREHQNVFVLPIDACDPFLSALTGSAVDSGLGRRADLLILSVEGDSVTLSPIEIKFYGLESGAAGTLPDPHSSSALDEALEQLNSTLNVLVELQTRWSLISSADPKVTADKALWANAFACLVESATKLSPIDPDEPLALSKKLSDISAGQTQIKIGSPVVAYFKHQAYGSDGSEYRATKSLNGVGASASQAFAALVANSKSAFRSLESDDSELQRDWDEIIDWALSTAEGSDISDDDQISAVGDQTKPSSTISHSVDEHEEQCNQAHNRGGGAKDDIEGTRSEPVVKSGAGTRVNLDQAQGGVTVPDMPPVGDVTPAKVVEPVVSPPEATLPSNEGIKFDVGDFLPVERSEKATFWPGNTALNQLNVGIVGDLGTGKTQLLKSLVYQMHREGKKQENGPLSMLIFDYKRDFQTEDFLESVDGLVLHINNIPLNFFELSDGYSPMSATRRANEFIDVLDKIYGGIGPVQKDKLQITITDLYRENKSVAPTIGRILRRYEEDSKPDSVTALLRKFVSYEIFTEDPEEFQAFEEIIDGRVVVVPLNEFGTDDDGKNALVVLFLNLYYDYMLKAKKHPPTMREDGVSIRHVNSFLLVDEAVNIMKYRFNVLMSLLLQGREFGVGVMLASQYLSHFKQNQEDYAQPLLTWFIHKVPSITPKELSLIGLPEKSDAVANKISKLELHQALYKSLYVDGRFILGTPFYKLQTKE